MEYILKYIYLGEVTLAEDKLELLMKIGTKLEIRGLHSNEPLNYAGNENTDEEGGPDGLDIKAEELEENLLKEYNINTEDTVQDTLRAALHTCDKCDYNTSTKEYLRIHLRSIHEGVKYPCDKCDYKATQTGSLLQHKQSVHEKIRYSCDTCDYTAARPARLKSQIKEAHEGTEYPCHQCDHKEPTKLRLNLHMKGVHEGVAFSCNQCDYKNVLEGSLRRHQEMVHFGLRYHSIRIL